MTSIMSKWQAFTRIRAGNRRSGTALTGCRTGNERRFCDSGILELTAEYVPQKFAARFRWIAHLED